MALPIFFCNIIPGDKENLMLNFSVDVTVMLCLSLLCLAVIYIVCHGRTTEADGRIAMIASAFTAIVMFVGYIVMAHVLDSVIGIYW